MNTHILLINSVLVGFQEETGNHEFSSENLIPIIDPSPVALDNLQHSFSLAASKYKKAALKTSYPKAPPIKNERLSQEQKVYAARAATYPRALLKSRASQAQQAPRKSKTLRLPGYAGTQTQNRSGRSHRSLRAPGSSHAPASDSGSSGDCHRPRTRSKFRVYIGSMRFDTMHAAMSDAAIETAKRLFPVCEILHRQMFSNPDQFPGKLSNIDVAVFIPYRGLFGCDRYKKLERAAILEGNPNALILTAEADGTFAATSLKPAARKSQDAVTEENCKKAFLHFVNGRTEADAACLGGLSPGEFKKFLNTLPDYAQAGQVGPTAVYTAAGKDVEAYFAGPDLVTANSYAQLIEKILRGEAIPHELSRFEGKHLQALKSGKSGFVKDKLINLCVDFSKISDRRAVRSFPKHDLEERRYVHHSGVE